VVFDSLKIHNSNNNIVEIRVNWVLGRQDISILSDREFLNICEIMLIVDPLIRKKVFTVVTEKLVNLTVLTLFYF
jgi:hypothetical protein